MFGVQLQQNLCWSCLFECCHEWSRSDGILLLCRTVLCHLTNVPVSPAICMRMNSVICYAKDKKVVRLPTKCFLKVNGIENNGEVRAVVRIKDD